MVMKYVFRADYLSIYYDKRAVIGRILQYSNHWLLASSDIQMNG